MYQKGFCPYRWRLVISSHPRSLKKSVLDHPTGHCSPYRANMGTAYCHVLLKKCPQKNMLLSCPTVVISWAWMIYFDSNPLRVSVGHVPLWQLTINLWWFMVHRSHHLLWCFRYNTTELTYFSQSESYGFDGQTDRLDCQKPKIRSSMTKIHIFDKLKPAGNLGIWDDSHICNVWR